MAKQRHLGQLGELLDVIVIGGSQAGFVREDAAYLADRITSRAPARRAGGQVLARR